MRHLLFGFLLFSALSSPLLNAASISYSGSFTHDNDVRLLSVTIPTTSTVTFRSFSYAGGLNSSGTVIPSGGFDLALDLFDASGVLINETDDDVSGHVSSDPVTQQTFDFYLQTTLAGGTYSVAIVQFDNFANGPNLSNGFLETSSDFTGSFGCTNGTFCDVTGVNRTANWAFDISQTPAVATPEPAASALLVTGLGALGLLARRRFGWTS